MPQYPLGRLVQHDERSRAYAFTATPRRLTSVTHQSHIAVLDQGDLGSCTGNATVGALGCDPYFPTETVTLDETLAVKVYSLATTLDDYAGTYPPTDSGSSGLAAAKAAKQLGLISGYQHAFNVSAALAALQTGPLITGIDWYESFFTPSTKGLVGIQTGDKVAGGHEIAVTGYDDANQLVWFTNSWSNTWGVKGRFCMTVATWSQLLSQDGDATILTPLSQPASVPTPAPTPPAADVDAALAKAFRAWEPSILARLTKAGQLKTAGDAWLKAHGY